MTTRTIDAAVSGSSRRVAFTVVRTFGPWAGEAWRRYVARTGLEQLIEVVTFDRGICPPAIVELSDEDHEQNLRQESRHHFFHDLSYLLNRIRDPNEHNILAVVEEPEAADVVTPPAEGFVLRGFDLVETFCDMSVLLGQARYARAFDADDVNPFGLVDRLDHARRIRTRLVSEYGHEPMGECRIWAIWRKER